MFKNFFLIILLSFCFIKSAYSHSHYPITKDHPLKIASGKFNFSKLICTPSMMGKIGKHGKVLGPKGLMPNPKLGTVSNDLKKSITDIKTGLVEIKNDKDGNLALSIGRKDFSKEKLQENYTNGLCY